MNAQASDLNSELHSPAKSEEPDEFGLIVNNRKYSIKAKSPFKGVYVSERLAVALRLVLQRQTTAREAARLYDLKCNTVFNKLRELKKRNLAQKCFSNQVQSLVHSRMRCHQRFSLLPYPKLERSKSILGVVKRMALINGVTFPKAFYDYIVKLEQGADYEQMAQYYSFNLTVSVKIIRFLKRAQKSARVYRDMAAEKIKDMLPRLKGSMARSSPTPNPHTPSRNTDCVPSPPKKYSYTIHDLSKARQLISSGETIKRTAKMLNIPYTTLYNHVKQAHLKMDNQRDSDGLGEGRVSCSPSPPMSSSSSSALTGNVMNLEGLAGRITEDLKHFGGTKNLKRKKDGALRCLFCHGQAGNEVELGKLHILNKVVVHYYCLLFSSALEQNGGDDEGILGFLPKDILKELNRGKKLKCVHCNQNGATIGCYSKYCKRMYHFPCGLKHHAQFVFTGNFRSMCSKHRKFQTGSNKGEMVECPICLQMMVADPKFAVWSPCCQKSSWFHRLCLQKLALSAGYFFKCPLCNDKNTFVSEMLQQGIFVPEQDASWELEPNAYQELLERPIRCDAPTCRCPGGRKNDEEGTSWEVVLCNLCGSTGVHVLCGKLRRNQAEWSCSICSSILRDSSLRTQQQKRKRNRNRIQNSDDDDNEEEEEESSTFTPSKRRCLDSSPRKAPPSDDDVNVIVDADCDGDDSEMEAAVEKTARPSSSSSSSAKVTRGSSDNEGGVNLDNEVFVPCGIRGNVVIADLIAEGVVPLSDALGELRAYAEGLPMKLVKTRFDEHAFLNTLNELSSGTGESTAYTLTKEHLRRFVRCTFTYDQMRLLRKVFELCFIIHALRIKISSNQKGVRHEPFLGKRRNYNRNLSLKKKIKAYQKSFINLLTQAKMVNLLEGNNTWNEFTSASRTPQQLDVGTSTKLPSEAASTSDAAASILNDEPSTSSTVRYIRHIKIDTLIENCAWCNIQLVLGVMPTTIILSLGHLEVVCTSCATLNVFSHIFPQVACPRQSSQPSFEYDRGNTDDAADENETPPSSEVKDNQPQTSPLGKAEKKQTSILAYFEPQSTKPKHLPNQKPEITSATLEASESLHKEPCPSKLLSEETETKKTTVHGSPKKIISADVPQQNKKQSLESTSASTKRKDPCNDLTKYRHQKVSKEKGFDIPPEQIIQSLCRPPTHSPLPISTMKSHNACQTCLILNEKLTSEKPLVIYCPCCNNVPSFCSQEHFEKWHTFTHNWTIIPPMHGNNKPRMLCKLCPDENFTRYFCPACPENTGFCSLLHYESLHKDAPPGSRDGEPNKQKSKEKTKGFSVQSDPLPRNGPWGNPIFVSERNSSSAPSDPSVGANTSSSFGTWHNNESNNPLRSADKGFPSDRELLKRVRICKFIDKKDSSVVDQRKNDRADEGRDNKPSGLAGRTSNSSSTFTSTFSAASIPTFFSSFASTSSSSTSQKQDDSVKQQSQNLQIATVRTDVGNGTSNALKDAYLLAGREGEVTLSEPSHKLTMSENNSDNPGQSGCQADK